MTEADKRTEKDKDGDKEGLKASGLNLQNWQKNVLNSSRKPKRQLMI